MIQNNINPVLLRLGPFSVNYYGLFIAIGFLGSYLLLKHFIRNDEKSVLKPSDVDDFFMYIILGVIFGARIFYTLVYNFNFYLSNPLRIFAVWQGGLSFHGGLIGCIIALLIYVKKYNARSKKKISVYDITDLCTVPLALSISLGRIGNFTNHELYGRVTELPWGVYFRNVEGARHPSQIYEAIYGILGILPLQLWLKTQNLSKGILTWSFIFLYGGFRFFTEFFRQPDSQIGIGGFFFGWITMGQILSIIMIITSITAIILIYKKEEGKYT